MVESLESRQLLAGFSTRIDFQTSTVAPAPYYKADVGLPYATKKNGLTFGWNIDSTTSALNVPSTATPETRYDTAIRVKRGMSWSIAVPNGTYDVRVSAGDALATNYSRVRQQIMVEGVRAIDARPSGSNFFIERSVRVKVSDGTLTVYPGKQAKNASVGWVTVEKVTSASTAAKLSWRTESAITDRIRRVEAGSIQIGNKLYILGGYTDDYDAVSNRVDIYDLVANRWTRGADLPGAQTHAAVATDGKYIYKVAGQIGPGVEHEDVTGAAWKYDIAKNKWTHWVDLPAQRLAGQMAYIDGKMHFFGGATGNDFAAHADHWVLDFADGAKGWQVANPLPVAADHFSHVIYNGEIYLVGGEHDHGRTYVQHDYLFKYVPATDTYVRLANLPTPLSHAEGSTFLFNNRIWVMGGKIDGNRSTAQVSSYDPATNNWQTYSDLPAATLGASAGVANNRVVFLGGENRAVGQTDVAYSAKLPVLKLSPAPTTGTLMFGTTIIGKRGLIEGLV